MYRVSLHYDVEGWAYHRRCLALMKYAPADFSVSLGRGRQHDRREACDLALQLCYPHCRALRRSYAAAGQRPLVVAGLNVGFTDRSARYLETARREADHVIVNSLEMFERSGRPAGTSWISNGVDREVFGVIEPIATRPRRVLWTGSLFHRQLKGYDEILVPLARRLWKDGIECDFRLVDSHGGPSRWSIGEMAAWYQTGAVYVCASATEGTPNPAIEAAASGCTIVSTRVGNMPELVEDGVNGFLVDRELGAIYGAVRAALKRYEQQSTAMQERIVQWGWDRRSLAYYDLFRRLLGRPRSRRTV
jgi:glycosyltransferase involved in cell wall biosynthesis